MPRVPADKLVPKASAEQKQRLTHFLVEHLNDALSARSAYIDDGGHYDTWRGMYEQAQRARPGSWPGAADLASYLPTEKVDALKARFKRILFGPDPVCQVEGWGEAPERCAKVEAFHQWKLEDTRLQSFCDKAIMASLIEQNGILEIGEAYRQVKKRDEFVAGVLTDQFTGGPVLDAEMKLQPERDDAGRLVQWNGDESRPSMKVIRQSVEYVSKGPLYRVVSAKDFQYLHAHARSADEVWGWAKRCWMRYGDLQQRAKDGLYYATAVAEMGDEAEREQRDEHTRQDITVTALPGRMAEKEVWEVQLQYDIDDDGIDEWLLVCISLRHEKLLRLAFDPVASPRYVSFVPYPRDDSVWGYSFIGHKLWTIADEHTSIRNGVADASTLAINRPMTKLSTSDYDPDIEPWAPGALLTVKSHNELQQLQVADVPASAQWRLGEVIGAAERLSGLADTAVVGSTAAGRTTATRDNIVANASFVRVEDPIQSLRESLEDLYLLNHAFWKKALEADESLGHAPTSAYASLSAERRGLELPEEGEWAVKASDLMGSFRFKPSGSVETADRAAMQHALPQLLQMVMQILQLSPQMMMLVQSNPQIAKTLLSEVFRLFHMPQLQALFAKLGSPQGAVGGAPMGGPSDLMAAVAQLAGGGGAPAPGGPPPPGGPPGLRLVG